jgi:hypothetical protein
MSAVLWPMNFLDERRSHHLSEITTAGLYLYLYLHSSSPEKKKEIKN